MASLNSKKLRMTETDPNLRSTSQGIILDLVGRTRNKFLYGPDKNRFKAIFDAVEKNVVIDEALWRINPDARPREEFWKSHIRNAGKDMGGLDMLTTGEIIPLTGGGYAVKGHKLPKGVTIRKIELRTPGLLDKPKPKVKPKAKKKRAIPKRIEHEEDPLPPHIRAGAVARRIRNLVRELDVLIRDDVVMQIRDNIEAGEWFFESRAEIKRRRSPRVTDED